MTVICGQPGPMNQQVHLYVEEEGVLKELELEFASEAVSTEGR
ncbi:MAG: hypothetical protein R3C03_20025 [Pirellulaceae bacterium]